jgi:hypothetical protein
MTEPILQSYSSSWPPNTRWSLACTAKVASLLPMPADGRVVDEAALGRMSLDSTEAAKDVAGEKQRVKQVENDEVNARAKRESDKTEWLKRVARHLGVGKCELIVER